MIKRGDRVRCVLPPAMNRHGQPETHPMIGQEYVVRDTYPAPYGTGVVLEDLDAFPYEGYVLWADEGNSLSVASGWYFEKVIKSD